jgi:hypothetical protein
MRALQHPQPPSFNQATEHSPMLWQTTSSAQLSSLEQCFLPEVHPHPTSSAVSELNQRQSISSLILAIFFVMCSYPLFDTQHHCYYAILTYFDCTVGFFYVCYLLIDTDLRTLHLGNSVLCFL